MRRLLITVISGLCCVLMMAQSQRSDEYFSRGVELYNARQYERSAELFGKCQELDSEQLPEGHGRRDYGKMWQASCFYMMGQTELARQTEPLMYNLVPIDRRLTKESDSLAAIAAERAQQQAYSTAIFYMKKAAEKERMVLGENSVWYANSLDQIAGFYHALGNARECYDYARKCMLASLGAVDYYSKVIEIYCNDFYGACEAYGRNGTLEIYQVCREVLESKDTSYEWYDALYMNTMRLGLMSSDTDYVKACMQGGGIQQWLHSCEVRHGVASDHYAYNVQCVTDIYDTFQQYQDASETREKFIDAARQAGRKDSLYARILLDQANSLIFMSRLDEAVSLASESLGISQKLQTDCSDAYHVLGGAYKIKSDFRKSEEYFKKELEVLRAKPVQDSLALASTTGEMAQLYAHLGDARKMQECYDEHLKISRQIYGEYSPGFFIVYADYINSMYDLQLLTPEELNRQTDYAFSLLKSGEDAIFKEALNHGKLMSLLSADLSLLVLLAQIASREEIPQLIDAVKSNFFSHEWISVFPPLYRECLNLLGQLYMSCNMYEEAVKVYETINNLERDMWGTETMNSQYMWGEAQVLGGNIAGGSRLIGEAISRLKAGVKEKFRWMTADERANYWTNNSIMVTNMPWIAFRSGYSPDVVSQAYDALLLSHGILLSSELELQNIIRQSGNTEMIALMVEWRRKKAETDNMLRAQQAGNAGITPQMIIDADNAAREIERQLVAGSSEFGDFTSHFSISWQDVQQCLGAQDVAIEFAVADTAYHKSVCWALVLTKDKSPVMLPVCSGESLEEIGVNSDGTQKMYDTLWKPLIPYIRKGGRIFFSAEGRLHQLPIEYAEGMEDYEIYRLSSTREIVLTEQSADARQAVLFGGLIYDRPTKALTAPPAAKALANNTFRDTPDLRAFRGSKRTIPMLPGSKQEVMAISSLLKEAKIPVESYQGIDGTEEQFKRLSGSRVSLLHISTHGFYSPEAKAMPSSELRAANIESKEDLSLSRCGLLFSGATGYLFGQGDHDADAEDGILTAKEISRVDLRGLELVVLSACETALGDVSSEGVFGLQRGLKKAGAQTILMSLWKVDDNATQILMTQFYQYLTQGESNRAALKKARQYLREYNHGQYDQPVYWAAFVLLDALR